MIPSVEALRRFAGAARPVRAAEELCELCGQPLPTRHEHLVAPGVRGLRCACSACASTASGGGRLLRVAGRAERLDRSVDAVALGVPVGLAFFVVDGAGQATALFPSPLGTIETVISPLAWRGVRVELVPFVEALLLRRGAAWIVSVDHGYRLSALLAREGEAAVDRYLAVLG